MTDIAATAQPETSVSGGQTASEITQTPASAEPAAHTPGNDLDEQLSRIWDAAQETTKPRAEPAKAQADAHPVSDQPAKAEPEPGQSSPAIAAPHSWSAEAKAEWSSLPPKAQQYIAQRESEFHKAYSQTGAELKAYQPLREVYSGLRQMGVPQGQEAEVISNWQKAQAFLDSNPQEGIKWLAKSYNVDLSSLNGNGVQQQQSAAVDDLFRDPRLDAQVLPVVNQLKTEVARLQGQLTAREHAELEQRQSTATDTIYKFAEGKADWGELVQDVTREVSILRQDNPRASMEELLQQAYDRARWANPVTRQRTLDAERKAETEKLSKEREKAAAEAKKHASMNVRTGASASTPVFDGPMLSTDKLSAIYDRINAG